MPNAISAFGTLLKIGDGAGPENFTTIGEVANISGPSLSMDSIDVTSHSSPDGWREFIGGLLDGGEISFDINFHPTESTHKLATGLLGDMSAKTVRNFELIFPDGSSTKWSFAALVTAFETGEPIDDKLSASVTLKLAGKPTLA
jgi:predicted secreted protein